MRVLVTGFAGQLGFDIIKVLKEKNVECRGIDIGELDLTDDAAVQVYLDDYKPDTVIHCAAYTAVDNAEDDKLRAHDVNVNATKYLAKACKLLDAKMMYFSTDYVFSGQGADFFETDDKCAPVSQYGYTKWLGEQEVAKYLTKYYILRLSWVFGQNGDNFVKTMLKLAETRDEISVVCDQIGSPTFTPDVAVLAEEMIRTDKYGVYHVTNEGICSWYDFAVEIFRQAGRDMKVNPIDSADFPSKAKRPLNSRLSKARLDDNGFSRLPAWQDALSRYLKA